MSYENNNMAEGYFDDKDSHRDCDCGKEKSRPDRDCDCCKCDCDRKCDCCKCDCDCKCDCCKCDCDKPWECTRKFTFTREYECEVKTTCRRKVFEPPMKRVNCCSCCCNCDSDCKKPEPCKCCCEKCCR